MTNARLSEQLKDRAAELGFTLAGICPAVAPPSLARFTEWLAAGYAGQMHYLATRAAAYRHPRHVLEGVRSIVMLAMDYGTENPVDPMSGAGRVSRYAWGTDYHGIIHAKLKELVRFVHDAQPGSHARGVVDTAPLLERDFAQLAGLGWTGKHTLLINRDRGSWFFLAALLTDVELVHDAPHETDHCGTCTACLDACPTDAFPAPYVLDATRCISYLTIELREAIPLELRDQVGDWVFGCDVCQDVCPWNRPTTGNSPPHFLPDERMNPLELADLFECTEAEFRERFRHTALWRARRRGILRNAAVVLGNQQNTRSIAALGRGLQDTEPLVRGAAAWALGKISGAAARDLLAVQLPRETDAAVAAEIRGGLAEDE